MTTDRPQGDGRHVDRTGDRPGFQRPDHPVHKRPEPKGHKTEPPQRKAR